MRRAVLLWLFLVMCLCRAQAAGEIPFEFRDGLIWLDVRVAERPETFHFLLDSGANVSVVDLATVRKLGANLGKKVSVQGVQSEVTGYWRTRLKASAHGAWLPSEYLALDLSALSGECKTRIDGLIGLDFFKGRTVEIDFETKAVRILASASKGVASVPMETRSCGLRIPVAVNGAGDQLVRVDTGCASALQWVASGADKRACQGSKVAVGLAPILIPQTVARVEIGPIAFDGVATGVHEQPIFAGEAGLLGNEMLRRFKRVTVDCKGGRLYLEAMHE